MNWGKNPDEKLLRHWDNRSILPGQARHLQLSAKFGKP